MFNNPRCLIMRVFFLAQLCPYAFDAGSKIRRYHALAHLTAVARQTVEESYNWRRHNQPMLARPDFSDAER